MIESNTENKKFIEIKENLAIKIIEDNLAGFAFPSQSIYLESFPSDRPEIFNRNNLKK